MIHSQPPVSQGWFWVPRLHTFTPKTCGFHGTRGPALLASHAGHTAGAASVHTAPITYTHAHTEGLHADPQIKLPQSAEVLGGLCLGGQDVTACSSGWKGTGGARGFVAKGAKVTLREDWVRESDSSRGLRVRTKVSPAPQDRKANTLSPCTAASVHLTQEGLGAAALRLPQCCPAHGRRLINAERRDGQVV